MDFNIISLNEWQLYQPSTEQFCIGERTKFQYKNKKWTLEIRPESDYDWHGWSLWLIDNKTGKEKQLHMLYDNKPVTTAEADLAVVIMRANEFLSESDCVQKEIFEGNLEF